MLKSADGGLRPVPFPVDDPERIPVKRYYDPEFYQAELDHLWPHVWQMACREEQIPEVGDWIEYENVGKSVIVVRTSTGIKAFNNACRHRGVPFAGGSPLGSSHATAHGNCAKSGFVCPFHGWRWNMDGENTLVYGKHLFSERQMDEDDINLIPCRAEVYGGCVWINHDADAPSVRESLGPVAERLEAHNLHKLRAEWCYGTVLPANWKIAMEAFMEGYHVMQTHPQLQHAVPTMYDSMYAMADNPDRHPMMADPALSLEENIAAQIKNMELLSEGMAGMLHEKEVAIAKSLQHATQGLPEDKGQAMMMWLGMVMHQVSAQLKERGEPIPDLIAVAQSDPVNAVEFLFPHYFLLPYFSSMSAYRIRPLGPESCFFEIWSLTFFPEGEEPEPVMEPIVLPFDSQDFPPIPRQDYSNIPIQQKGLHASGFEFMRLSGRVEGLISNYQRIIDGYLAGVPGEKLAAANNKLGGNFDGRIEDLGF
ncbi:aromatic ring-hydroxylating oxygenase subunit alpha [Novosphingobium guangzhouense]|uniref:aromatic ring-hydroxylating oxygenase subunit alpha n=1 Tax=Novosphingobium guangzhouense TaxID=1850347 RepID=UPI000CCC4118|nr:aromatic ring-hydroxylating dioxygenase subunit alpha [Novosphingobium guangzhouense]